MRRLRLLAPVPVLVVFALLAAWARSTPPATAASKAEAAKASAAPAAGGFQADMLGNIGDAEKKVLSLDDAIPPAKFTWRPAPGVRSISEVFLHIAFANYGILKMMGHEPPADAGWEMNMEKWDKHTTDKAEIKKILQKSYDHVRATVKAIPDADLDKKVKMFGMELTVRAALIGLVGHNYEHLGQSIAYARSNNVVPPWSK